MKNAHASIDSSERGTVSGAEKYMHCQHTQAVGLLPFPVSLTVIAISRVTSTQHAAEVICALLLTGGLGTHIVI